MSEPIKVGDLVVAIGCCCGTTAVDLGKIGTVLWKREMVSHCYGCDTKLTGVHVACTPTAKGGPISWVKRIPPLDELEGEKRKEDLTA